MKFLLYPISLIYQFNCLIINLLYRWRFFKPKKSPLPVISIGNISFGGSEKTPMAKHILSELLKSSYKPALVARGYRGKWERCGGMLSNGRIISGSWQESGDEPFMIARSITEAGIFIGKDRLSGCRKAKELGFDIVVLDDAFQYHPLEKDINIVMYDPKEKITLREPKSSIGRSHAILIKKNRDKQIKSFLQNKFPQIQAYSYSVVNKGLYSIFNKQLLPPAELNNKTVLSFSGIARPERFKTTLKKLGVNPVKFLKFPDHHPYPPKSIKKIKKYYLSFQADIIITTEKDMVKLAAIKELEPLPLYYLKIDLKIEKAFYTWLWSRQGKKGDKIFHGKV